LIHFGCLSFTTIREQKIGFNSCECTKILSIANFHVFHVWEKRILSCNDTTFFLHFSSFFAFAMQLFPTPVASPILHNQAPLFTAFTGHPLDAVIIAPTDFSEIGLLYEVGDCSRRKAKMLEVCHFIHDC